MTEGGRVNHSWAAFTRFASGHSPEGSWVRRREEEEEKKKGGVAEWIGWFTQILIFLCEFVAGLEFT